MPYIYRITRREPSSHPTVQVKAIPAPPEPEAVELSYRDLQAQAKELGISAKQTREDLESAIAEATPDD